jgi:glycosyltransferase involved in cell wall biosynthesis
MRIDLHVHSKFSKRPNQWILKKIGCPESFTEPLQVYQTAKTRGMTHVTITDHNSIDGALEIAHLPGTFISEEITTYFPDNNCKIHLLALNITEAQHKDIQELRPNIYELAQYLAKEEILNIVAHPLYAINERLTIHHFEQLLLLFNHFEVNGARNPRENEILQTVLNNLHPKDLVKLAAAHDIVPLYPLPWEKRIFGGSDDHSALRIARTFTDITGADSPSDLKGDLSGCRLKVHTQPSQPQTMAHNIYSIAYQFFRSKFNLSRYDDKDILLRFLDHCLCPDVRSSPSFFSKIYLLWRTHKQKPSKSPASDSLMTLVRHETQALIQEDLDFYIPRKSIQTDPLTLEKKWFDFVNRASNRMISHFSNHLLDHLSGANVFNIFHTIGSAGGLYTMLAPYFVAYVQFSKDREFSQVVSQRFDPEIRASPVPEKPKANIAHFTDTFYEVNGVALTLQQQIKLAKKNHKALQIITCHPTENGKRQNVINFQPISVYQLPEYPELKIFFPPLIEMLQYCYEKEFNHIHTATPGPIGLAALAIAKILKLPISGTYHTAIPQYAQILTADSLIEDMTWKYTLWYYDQLDVIYAPSKSTRDELVTKGIRSEKIKVYPRGIDTQRFHPSKGNGILKKWFDIDGGTVVTYVGRVSKEKNLDLLVDAFKQLCDKTNNIHMVIVGEGPYLSEMEEITRGLPCHFTGYLTGERLPEVYASSDMFVFPSTTDTFGNVVLEAQASGLPVIVTDKGGPRENMIHGKTGLIVSAGDSEALFKAMHQLTTQKLRRKLMSHEARQYVEERSFESAFLKTWEFYHDTLTRPNVFPRKAV